MLNQTLKTVVRSHPEIVPMLKGWARFMAKHVLALKADDLSSINNRYNKAIVSALIDYFEGGGVAASRSEIKQAIIEAFGDAFDTGWVDSGGELPIDDEALSWVEGRINQEFDYVDGLFADAKQLRKNDNFDYFTWSTQRADGYTQTLASIYNAAALIMAGRKMLTWRLGETEKHCDTCLKLDGQRHRSSWFMDHNYVPRQPGAGMDCGGYNCDCRLEDDDGNEVTI